MRININTITPPVGYPVERSDMLNFLKLDEDNPALTREIQFIEDLIAAATSMCEEYCSRAFLTQTLEMIATPQVKPHEVAGITTYGYELMPSVIKIWRPPCQSVTSITSIDLAGTAHIQSATNYIVNIHQEPALIQLNFLGTGWETYAAGFYKIRIVAGYGDTVDKVPPMIRQAIRATVSAWYWAREKIDYSLPAQAIELLNPYRIEVEDLD